ncbi:T9SS type A sorting domain-containing protein [Paraflavitalea speifideaquila]|uniref:T9SS type A sorting domain-containing protein n=1 Tax=Paraflavitalea speifideaquila TaxID=3076558 RepID=UPI0028E2EC2C|nr:T9SS type A sorting domain-containing protein [Paraflavitalea speifideiaquila]
MIYPNPIKGEATLTVYLAQKQPAVYSVFDLAGNRHFSKTVSLQAGWNTIPLTLSSLLPGNYILQLAGNGITQQTRLVKL